MGLVRYRRWEGSVIVELLALDEPAAIVAAVPGSDRPRHRPHRLKPAASATLTRWVTRVVTRSVST